MIIDEVKGDALEAKEPLLLVPTPIGETEFYDGFIGQVVRRFPQVQDKINARGGLGVSETMLVGPLSGDKLELAEYTLVFAAFHRRREGGWNNSPALLANVLTRLHEEYPISKLATAGIPGEGYSGLLGHVDSWSVGTVLQMSEQEVVIYRREDRAGDREGRIEGNPDLSDKFGLVEKV